VDILAFGVPFLYLTLRLIFKGTIHEKAAEISWDVVAALLFILAILKLVLRWQERAQEHSRLLGENITLVGLADNLLLNQSTATAETIRYFNLLTERSEREDRESLGEVSPKDKQFAYREGLKESEPGNTAIVCPVCKSSPYQFTPGSCQVCGNTPRVQVSSKNTSQ
jgi:mobilome CxxCx(11)CxxC protein